MADRKRPKYKVSPLSPEPKDSVKRAKKPPSTMAEPKKERVAKRKEAGKVSPQTAKRKKPVAAKKDIPTEKAAKKVVKKRLPVKEIIKKVVSGKGKTAGGRGKFGGRLGAFVAVGTALVTGGKAIFDASKKRRLDKATTPDSPSVGKPTEQRRVMERLQRERTHRAKVQLYTPLKEVHVPDTRAKKTVTPRTTGASGDGPGPTPPTPKSVNREKQMRDFAKHNKAGSKIGMKMDDILRGAFSFMGALPKSTAKDKWTYK